MNMLGPILFVGDAPAGLAPASYCRIMSESSVFEGEGSGRALSDYHCCAFKVIATIRDHDNSTHTIHQQAIIFRSLLIV